MKGFASMVEIAYFQTPLAVALINGKGTDVIKVNVCILAVYFAINVEN